MCFIGVKDLCGWKVKTYGVACGPRPRAELIAAAGRVATDTLPERPDLDGAFGMGFLIVHDADDGCLALVHWWVRPDELHQRVFAAPHEKPQLLAPPLTAAIGRLPELAIIEHERRALARHVLESPSGPDLDAYLSDVLA